MRLNAFHPFHHYDIIICRNMFILTTFFPGLSSTTIKFEVEIEQLVSR